MLFPTRPRLLAGTVLALASLAAGCNPPSGTPQSSEPAAETTQQAASAATTAEATTPTPTPAPAPAAAGGHNVDGGPAWQTWETGSAIAREANKPMMVFVYTDWCSRCGELEPVFAQPEVVEASSGLVLIRQNQDEPAPWLQSTAADTDTYVPRVLFLNPDGSRRAEVSPHPRYPLFYTPGMVSALVANMRAVAGS